MSEELLDSAQAAQYLAQKWKMAYDEDKFRALRFRLNIEPDLGGGKKRSATYWKRSTLDTIEKPDRTKPRGKRKKEGGKEMEAEPSADHQWHSCQAELALSLPRAS